MSDGLRGYIVVCTRHRIASQVGWVSSTKMHHEVIIQVRREIERRNPRALIMTELQDWA